MEYADENQTETWDENADFKTFGSLFHKSGRHYPRIKLHKVLYIGLSNILNNNN